MSSKVHHHIAVELGFEEKIVKRALAKYKFKSAGDFVDYLEMNEDEFAVDEEVDEEPAPGEEKITIVTPPDEEKVAPTATAQPNKSRPVMPSARIRLEIQVEINAAI